MIRQQQPALSLLAIGLIGMGTLSVISRDFAFVWQPVPQFHPGREALAVVCGLFMIAVSVALLFRSTVAIASRVLFLFLIAWLSLKVPAAAGQQHFRIRQIRSRRLRFVVRRSGTSSMSRSPPASSRRGCLSVWSPTGITARPNRI